MRYVKQDVFNEWAVDLYEGSITGGSWNGYNGFGRYISGMDTTSITGWWEDGRINGQFVYFKDRKLVSQGELTTIPVPGEVQEYEPTESYEVSDFSSRHRE